MSQKAVFAVLLIASLFLVFVFVVGVSAVNSNVAFNANVKTQVSSISIKSSIAFGNITKGYSTDKIKVDINNTGTTAVIVTPQLSNISEDIFNHSYFARRTTEPYYRIGNFSLNISQPSAMGDVVEEYFYAKLDLSNFKGNIPVDRIGHTSNIIFYVMPQ